jgi:hypothetical protein
MMKSTIRLGIVHSFLLQMCFMPAVTVRDTEAHRRGRCGVEPASMARGMEPTISASPTGARRLLPWGPRQWPEIPMSLLLCWRRKVPVQREEVRVEFEPADQEGSDRS